MLILGTATRDITPLSPCYLAGFAHRSSLWTSIYSPLFLKVFVFEDGHTHHRAAVVVADVIGWDGKETAQLEKELCEAHGFGSVIFNATHTHSAPCMTTRGGALLIQRDMEYLRNLYTSVKEAVAEALENAERVTASALEGNADGFFINRRLSTAEGIKCDPNPLGPVDPTVTLWRFDRMDGTPKAVWVHAACHPTILAGNAVAGDFAGALVTRLEPRYPGATVAFLQGCCGDVRVNITDEEGLHFRRTDEGDLEDFTNRLAAEVSLLAEGPAQSLGEGSVSSHVSVFEQALNVEAGVAAPVPIRVTTLRLTERAGLVAICGEPSVFYQHLIRSQPGLSLLALGYSNGTPGYLPTAEQIREGGYEGLESCKFFGLPGPFAPSLEENLCSAITSGCHLTFGEAVVSDLLSFQ